MNAQVTLSPDTPWQVGAAFAGLGGLWWAVRWTLQHWGSSQDAALQRAVALQRLIDERVAAAVDLAVAPWRLQVEHLQADVARLTARAERHDAERVEARADAKRSRSEARTWELKATGARRLAIDEGGVPAGRVDAVWAEVDANAPPVD